jgi:hypothetical protein
MLLDVAKTMLSGARIMTDSDNSTSLLLDIRRPLSGFRVASHTDSMSFEPSEIVFPDSEAAHYEIIG